MFGKDKKQLVYIGSDHAAFEAKEDMRKYYEEKGYDVTDLGCFNTDSCDYPDYAREVGEKVLEHEGAYGVLICGTGIGMSMASNRLQGIRAVLATDEHYAEMGRNHNNANVLCMGSRTTDIELMKKISDKFLATEFAGEERHIRRVDKMDG
ncbi:ribose 5-phosphate isomerase B [Candidatus Peregrinibacteria bacterium]|jgi:ribose 5-phosphate isomerase B|nr:ribose 5-phosphate isomerase B [Candidatus Peregrinibacteria bacterium]MBT7736612.1 ribose 5-phosphate isomerase B [Candidatus Peregrinibacteria bacterium]